MVRALADKLKLKDQHGKPYTSTSNITRLMEGFYKRAEVAGVVFVIKGGRGLSRQRQLASGPAPLVEYRDKIAEPTLKACGLVIRCIGALVVVVCIGLQDQAVALKGLRHCSSEALLWHCRHGSSNCDAMLS